MCFILQTRTSQVTSLMIYPKSKMTHIHEKQARGHHLPSLPFCLPPSLPAPSASLSWFPVTNMSIVYSSVRTSGTLRGPDLPAHLWEDPGSHIRLHIMLTQKPRVHPVHVPQDRESQLMRQNGKGSCWDFWNSEPLGHLIREDESPGSCPRRRKGDPGPSREHSK